MTMFVRLFQRTPPRLAMFLFGSLAVACATAGAPTSNELTLQRERFPLVWEAAQHGPEDAWRKLAMGLESYPLYPYLELAGLQKKLPQLKPDEAEKFLAAWPDSLPAQTLREAFLLELAKRSDWKNFLVLYADTTRSKELQCDALQARIALGQTPDFEHDVTPLWLSTTALPAACDAAVAWARQRGKLTPALIWQRINLAAGVAHSELVATLASMLDGDERTAAERMALALRDPAAAMTQSLTWPDKPHARDALVLAFERLARRDSDTAETQWARLATHFHFDAEQRGRILRAIAVYRASSYAPDALARLNALPADAADDAAREWHVRLALAAQDWKTALVALEKMSPAQQADARWRYLRARVLVKLDRNDEATPVFQSVAREANFHGFLAADWLKQPYTICPTQVDADTAQEDALRQRPGLARAFEFFSLNRLTEARREWGYALPQLDPRDRRLAVDVASRLGWHDRAVYALNQGDDLHLYDLRFPLARRAQIERDAHAAGIDPAWAYAIIRAESAWTSDARSGADAWGLMQLLPSTARQLAKVEKVSFSGAADLFDPDLNIRLGTRYLGNMALHYDGSPWLATAAYNAGADPVGRWIDARDSLEPDFFIETIPYKETREYVARVLAFSVIYDWRLHGTAQPLASRLPRIGQAYTPPSDEATRKAVVCPVVATSTDAASAAATPTTAKATQPPASAAGPQP
jgi:soluble lytic murein transglycosylase